MSALSATASPPASLATFAHLTRRRRMSIRIPRRAGSPPAERPPLKLCAVLARDYELVLMLDPEAPDGRRDELAGETRKRIESGGELRQADTWGMRKLAFEIRQRTEADYRFYRFEAENDLLEQLDHSLKITDGVLRFRIFKVDSGTPTMAPPPTAQPSGVSARAARAEARRTEEPAREAPSEEAEAEAASEEAPAEPAEPEPVAEAPDAGDEEAGETASEEQG
jgi:small subunit ribosomal protein S6